MGANYPDSPADNDLFEALALGEKIQEGVALLHSISAGNTHGITAEELSKIWMVSPQDAEQTIRQTTQRHPQNLNTILSRQFGTNDRNICYNRLASVFFTDTLQVTKEAKSTRGYKYCQVFVSDRGFIFVFCMQHQSDYLDALKAFSKEVGEVGAPDKLVCDPHPTQVKKEV